MKRANFIWLLTVPLVLTSFVGAWGHDGHRRINYMASRQLSGPFGQFLRQHSEPLKWYAAAPDYNKKIDPGEFHRHFIDADHYDVYPFNQIPKNYDALIATYGEDAVKKYGIAPWAIENTCNLIIDMMKQDRWDDAVYYMGVLGHYIADLHQPLHTIVNYDGQFTGNDGIHFRWEERLVEEYIDIIKPVGKIETVDHPWNYAMKIVRESFPLHQQILEADIKARQLLSEDQAKALDTYDILDFEKPYLDVLYKETESLLKDRMGRAAIRLASIWQYCWEQAGSPELP